MSLGLTDDVGCFEPIYTGKTAVCNAPASALKKNVVVSSPPPGGGQNAAPVITSASLSRTVFAVNTRGAAEVPVVSRSRKGTTFRYTLSEDARVAIAIQRALPGRRVGRKCVRPTAKNRRKRKCTRYVRFGAFAVQSPAGANRHAFSGRIGRKRLKPGRYRAILVATDAGGLASAAKSLNFKVVRR